MTYYSNTDCDRNQKLELIVETYNVYGILSVFMRSNNKILTGHYFSYLLFESVSPVEGETKNGDACSNNNNLYGILSLFLSVLFFETLVRT